MKNKKISIIIPVYNTEKYLEECLDSIVGQTLRDIEIICVNDGSTDSSLAILKRCAAKDNRIIIIDKENEGAGISRNKGLLQAQGEAVIFFDSDDYMELDALEKMYDRLVKDGSDLVVCQSSNVDSDGTNKRLINYSIRTQYNDWHEIFSIQEFSQYALQILIGWPWDKLFRRDFIVENNLQFQDNKHTNDTYFILSAVLLSKQISCLYEPLILYRKHNDSISSKKQVDASCFYKALTGIREKLIEVGLYEKYEVSYINYFLKLASLHHSQATTIKWAKEVEEYSKSLVADIGINKFKKSNLYEKSHYRWVKSIALKPVFSLQNHRMNSRVYRYLNISGLKFTYRNKKRELKDRRSNRRRRDNNINKFVPMERTLKILYVISSLRDKGGMQRILLDKTDYLIEKGHEIHIMTTRDQAENRSYTFDSRVNFHKYWLPATYPMRRVSDLKKRSENSISYKNAITDLATKIKPDVIVWMLYGENLIAERPDGVDCKTIAEFHNTKGRNLIALKNERRNLFSRLKRWLFLKMEQRLFVKQMNRLDKFVVLTKESKNKQWKGYIDSDKLGVISNFSQMESIDKAKSDCTAKRVIAIGRLTEVKNFTELIKSWSIVNKSFPNWRLSIYGNGDFAARLQEQIDALHLQNVVKLEGVTDDISKEYFNSSIYAMSSRHEGMPLVLLEAMIHGLPIVSYACPCGPRDLIEHDKTGIIVDRVGDVKGLADGMMRLMADENMRISMGRKAKLRAQHLYSKERVMKNWLALFDNLI